MEDITKQPPIRGDRGNIENEIDRNPDGTFMKGREKTGGRTDESLSITTEQKKFFRENPEAFRIYCEEIRKDPSMKKIVWSYIDGMPRQNIGLDGGKDGQPLSIKWEE